MHSNVLPVAPKERIVLLDVLRGVAIFGILMVNLPLMYEPMLSMILGAKTDVTLIIKLSELFIKFFFEGKFYVLFSMLFGYGFWIFINKKTDDGRSIIPVFRRRVFFLLLFGMLHVVLLWAGDILVFYALFGFLLLLFKKVSDRGLVKWAIWVAIIPGLLTLAFALLIKLASMQPEVKAELDSTFENSVQITQQLVANVSEAYSSGTFADAIKARLKEYQVLLPGILFFYPVVLGMFLLGVWAARKGIIANYTEHLDFFRKAFWWGLSIGVVFAGLYTYTSQFVQPSIPGMYEALNTISHTVGGFFLSLMYISGIILLAAKGKLETMGKIFAPVGRMALTNYLMHSIIGAILFMPFGFGLFGKIEMWQGILITIAIFALQIPLSRFWLSKFHFGPFEWLWRSLTYMKVQPFKK